MITTLWRKHWMELRGIWGLAILFAAFPAILLTGTHPGHLAHPLQFYVSIFTLVMLLIPPRFAGTGLMTSKGIVPQRDADPSLFFTLSLPLRRRTLFIYRAIFGLFLLEAAAVLGLLIGTAVFDPFGGSWLIGGKVLRLLLALVPIYFLDTLLSTRYSEVSTLWMHMGCLLALGPALPALGVHTQTVFPALESLLPIPFALGALLIAAGLAAVTIWRLDRQDY
jgi:hypothetical protein